MVASGCLSWNSNSDDDDTLESYITVLNRRAEDVDLEIVVHDDTAETSVVDETVTIPAEERHSIDFTTSRGDDGVAWMTASIRNLEFENGEDGTTERSATLGNSSTMGFAGSIEADGSVRLGTDEQ